jgi:membrane associated rhomboid family serine protease
MYERYRRSTLSFGYGWTPAVKVLIIINVVIYGLILFTGIPHKINHLLGLVPADVFGKFHIWQFVTYMFLHGGFFHLLINMFILWMFGSIVERAMGTKEFLKYFFITGVGAGFFNWIFSYNSQIPIVGASGAIYGILVAFAMFFPNQTILLYFIIPVKAKYLAIGFAVIEFLSSFRAGSGIAHLAHLGGMVIGFVYIKYGRTIGKFLKKTYRNLRESIPSDNNTHSQSSNVDSHSSSSSENFSDRQKVINMVDVILDKINKEGYSSLSDQERRILKKASDIFSDEEE